MKKLIKLFYLNVLLAGFFSIASEQRELLTLVTSDTEFQINKDLIAKLSPVIKNFLHPELQKTGIEQAKFELTSIKPAIIRFIVQALPALASLEKVICEGKENELRFYSIKDVKTALEPWWKSVTYYLTRCPIAAVPLFQQRFKGELLRAAHYLEIEPLEKYIAYKIAQELHNGKIKDVSEKLLKTNGYGYQSEVVFKLINHYFKLIETQAEEYTVADYILEHGQPEMQINTPLTDCIINYFRSRGEEFLNSFKLISLQNKHITSLFGLSSLDSLQEIVFLDVGFNKLVEIEKNQINYLSNLKGISFFENNIRDIDPGSFAGIQKLLMLELSGNPINQINSTIFQGLDELQELNINNAQIKDLEPGIFEKLSNLNVLSLVSNTLTQIKPDTFRGLANLKKLDLSYNKIINLDKNSFNGLDVLSELNLQSNWLFKLNDGVFDGMPSLSTLYLNRNQLSSMDENIFAPLENLTYLAMQNNKLSVLPASFYTLKNAFIMMRGNPLSLKTKIKLMYYQERYNFNVYFR